MALKVLGKALSVPLKDVVVDDSTKATKPWEDFFKEIIFRLIPLGREVVFQLDNNIATPTDIDGLTFNSDRVSQAHVDFLVQRVTADYELVESGSFILSYFPISNRWSLDIVSDGKPNDAGVDFSVAQPAFTGTYNHTTGFWTGASIGNGSAVTLFTFNTLPTGFLAATTYYVVSTTGSTFKLSLTVGGSPVTASTDDGFGIITVTPAAKAGQVQYTSSNLTGAQSISRVSYRSRTLAAKSSLYSTAGVS